MDYSSLPAQSAKACADDEINPDLVGESLQRFGTLPEIQVETPSPELRQGATATDSLFSLLRAPFSGFSRCMPKKMMTRQKKSNSVFRIEYACKGAGVNAASKEDRVIVIEDYEAFVRDGYASYDVRKYGDAKPSPPPANSFKIPPSVGSNPEQTPVDKFKLFAVFDGHCGAIASSFLQYRFPYELSGTPEFHTGDYSQALTSAFQRAHTALLECKSYAPEAPNNDFSSGCTASVVLVTPTTTYFAMVGDSPIMIWKQRDIYPDLLFKEHDADNPSIFPHIVASNMFLVMVREVDMHNTYYIVTSEKMRAKLLHLAAASSAGEGGTSTHNSNNSAAAGPPSSKPKGILKSERADDQGEITTPIEQSDDTAVVLDGSQHPQAEGVDGILEVKDDPAKAPAPVNPPEFSAIPGADDDADVQFDDLRIGMSALNVFGTLGDSFYDPAVFNTFIDELVAFRQDRVWRYNAHIEKVKSDPSDLTDSVRKRRGPSAIGSLSGKAPKRNRKESLEITTEATANSDARSGSPIAVIPKNNEDSIFAPQLKFAFEKMHSLSDLEGVNPLEFPYSELREWLLVRPNWAFLSKHLSLLKKESQMSRVLLSAVIGLDHRHRLNSPGLVRVPEVAAIPNHELRSFVIASDGVIRFYKRCKKIFQSIISRNADTPEKCVEEMMSNLKWLKDDRSIIVCRFGVKSQLAQP
ncbi:hypothetical protein SeMB42_g04131 [Synchytrium endobioticum]|uniref:PPM-type phosphatase domain-containing protein n=1 Tax=Synchytrium endobioticum TaxID=286115 RepID=A0A507D129_9FUNG|nr:hypothetical protein SeLEV6574_g07804 [Synchytrium endobioticum]TPX45011.1 hypothetical protein SeMB42_g04131 [Synchytrium endobioticum]